MKTRLEVCTALCPDCYKVVEPVLEQRDKLLDREAMR